ncbi:hypothetical protein [Mesorhizobium sp. B2-3-5]|uniref:hypothetical protein n=1 Tax=Mesorhizobium sp. B2-3-5 TaxID=2589958 RepID=UPI002484A9A7|nr:hypothetical protein [Mesorhizobium sp. B2-3-5]
MEAGRQALWLPVDIPAQRLSRAALDQLEQAVAGADIPATVGLDDDGRPRSSGAWIDDTEEDGSRREPLRAGRQQVGRRIGIADRRIGEEIDRGDARRHLVQHSLHLTRVGAVQAEIREQDNH